jgi:predicted dehydrogenase
MSGIKTNKVIDRRSFIRSTAAVGAGLAIAPKALGQLTSPRTDSINVAILGAGAQGRVLVTACLKIPGVRFKAVCDIWDYNRGILSRLLKEYGHENNAYIDYQEMLAKEKGLDAVIVATPDFWHAEQTIDCLKAGRHVYCEKEMSNTLEGAKRMALAARETGKLLQIGHQRRSNPRYVYCHDKLLQQARLLGRITTVNGQWNRSCQACEDLSWPKGSDIDPATLKKYGFDSMQQFRNWRWYKGLGGGPIVDLGSHQIDIYNWFLGTRPVSVIASGGIDYWKVHEWYDNVMAVYEYQTTPGTVRAFYQTLTTNSAQGYFESFMGDEGTLVTSEASGRTAVYRESYVPEQQWYEWEKKRFIKRQEGLDQLPTAKAVLDARVSPTPARYDLLVDMNKPYHQPHLENFFAAIRGQARLTCPAEIGYETAVTVLKVNQAVEAGRKLLFEPEEFEV